MLFAALQPDGAQIAVYTITALVLGGVAATLISRILWVPPTGAWVRSGNAMEYRVTDKRGRSLVVREAKMQRLADDIWIVTYREADLSTTSHNHLVCFNGNFLGSQQWALEVIGMVSNHHRDFLDLIPVNFEVKNDLLDDVPEAHHYKRHLTLFVNDETMILCSRENFNVFDEPWLLKSSGRPDAKPNWSTVDLPHQAAKALKGLNGVQIIS